MKFSFRRKLLCIFITVIFIISCITAFAIHNYEYKRVEARLFTNAENQSVQIDNYISSLFTQIKSNVKFLTSSADIANTDNSIAALFKMNSTITPKKYSKNMIGLEGRIYDLFEQYSLAHLDTSSVYIGTIWGGFMQYPDGVDVSSYDPRVRPWYIQAMNNPDTIIISDPYTDYFTKDYRISACSAIKNSTGNIVGVLGLDLNLDSLSGIISKININDGSYTFLFNKAGTIIASPDTKLNFKNIKTLSTTGSIYGDSNKKTNYYIKDYEKLINEDRSNFETIINGQPVLISLYTSQKTNWKIATVIPKEQLINESRKITYFIYFIAICVIAAALFVFSVIAKKITEPITELAGLMQSAENGNLNVQADIRTKDEFKKLGECFNSMIQKLKSNYQELSALYMQLYATEEEIRTQNEELQNSHQILRKADERYRLALDSSNDAIWELDLETFDIFISDKFYEMTGYPTEKSKNLNTIFNDVIHPDDKKRTKTELYDFLKNDTDFYQSEFRFRTKDDSYIWVYNKGRVLKDDNGKALKMAGSTTDITEIKSSQEKILYMAHYDTLTNLPNRNFFMEKLQDNLIIAKKQMTQVAILFIDLDNFKIINDTMGHNYGDKLLKHIADELQNITSMKDTVFRLGGDEFVIIYPLTTKEDVISLASKTINLFNKVFIVDEVQLCITASIGIAMYPKDGSDVNHLLKNADAAMYESKELGKNRYTLYDEKMFTKLQRRTQIHAILRTAIENGELSVYYQPQYDASTNEIYGFEALLRLNSKELGFISPAEFIPIAEETGLINEIGRWVFEKACIQSYEWLQKGYTFSKMSVNISSVQMNHPDFLDLIINTIERIKINPNLIELEITESVLMQSIDINVQQIEKLIKMGIRIALDDFGTGYSSLNYLRKIPLSTLKVDKSFIDNMASSTKEEILIRNIIKMSHGMDLKVVAEGVEDLQQLITLKKIKCDYIQGYYFSKPLPAVEIEKLFKE